MLRPLLYLSALSLLADAIVLETLSVNSKVNISSCPITYYGRKYEQYYLNITGEKFAMCFNGFFNPPTKDDCIVGPQVIGGAIRLQMVEANSFLKDLFSLPTTTAEMKCILGFSLSTSGELVLGSFGTQTTLRFLPPTLGSFVFDILVDGVKVDVLNVTNTVTRNAKVVDISGCRHSGALYKPGTVSFSPELCLACDAAAVLYTESCGAMGHCQGNSSSVSCISVSICTVTGPSIIDFTGQVNSVQDRCAYSLMANQDFHLWANFQERRRKDVSFLDSVTLHLGTPGVRIHLEQGGRVRLNNTVLNLYSSTLLVEGVQLSKDHTGVTAKLSFPSYNFSVFFDGYMAQIHPEGPGLTSGQGLCFNSSRPLSEAKLSASSDSGCEIQYNDTADATINCNATTERCNLLKGASFSACHNATDPEPYVTACTNTLCKYPTVDGLGCQFLEAYTRACSLRSADTPGGWRSKAGCSAGPQAFCQNRTCGAHEFCGEKTLGGETICFCRPIFASPYRSAGTLGGPTVCAQSSASLTLFACLLEENGIEYSSLHLNDQTCRGRMDEFTRTVTFSFNGNNSCGAVVTNNNSLIIYKNAIVGHNSSSNIITRQGQVYIDFSCVQTQPDISSMSFRVIDSSVVQYVTSGAWNYSVTMKAYTDAGRTQAVDSVTRVQLDQKIWVELGTDGLDGSMVAMVTESCWATDQPSVNGSPRYNLIVNGCANPADQTVKMEGNGLGVSNYFSFNMFQFSGGSGDVYLHCKLNLCVRLTGSCAPVCNRAVRRRRFARSRYEDEATAFISMAWIH